MRNGRHPMQRDELLSETQRTLAEHVRHTLRRFHVSFSESVESNRREAWYTFRIEPDLKTGPDVRVQIVGDAFVFVADDACLYRDRAAWGRDDVSAWIAECLDLLELLLRHPLEVRTRRTWLGRRTGAVWVPAKDGRGAWSGDLAACRGSGVESSHPARWYRRAPE